MFSKAESKEIREQFWIFFGKRYPRKWLLYNTKIKDVYLKFSFNTKQAQVSLDCESTDETFRAYYYENILSLRTILKEEVSQDLIFDEAYVLENGKVVSRVYVALEGVSIHNKEHWPQVFDFFYEYMDRFEVFFNTYRDIIDS